MVCRGTDILTTGIHSRQPCPQDLFPLVNGLVFP